MSNGLFSNVRGLLWQADIEDTGEHLVWSNARMSNDEEAAMRFLPVAMQPGETYLQAWRRARHPEDDAPVRAYSMQQIRANRSYTCEFRIILKDGSIRWLKEDVYLQTIAPGRWHATGVDTDITDQKLAERFLEEQNRILELITTDTPLEQVLTHLVSLLEAQSPRQIGSILLLDAERKRLLTGAAPRLPREYTEAIHGVEIGPGVGSCGTAAYLGKPVIVEDIAVDPLWEGYRDLALRHGLRACWSLPIFARNGAVLGTFAMYYPERCAPAPEDLERLQKAAHLARLAIEHARTAEALRHNEQRLRVLIESSPLGICVIDPSGAVRQYNRRLEQMLGPFDGSENALSFVHPEDLPEAEASLAELLSGALPQSSREIRLVDRNANRIVWARVTGATLQTGEEGEKQFLYLIEDITERRRLEEQLLQAQKMESIGRLAGGIAHDFNNLLTAISGYTHLAIDALPPDHEAGDYLKNIHRATDRAARLTGQLLAFARRQIIAPEVISVNDQVQQVLTLIHRLIGEDITVVTSLAEDLWPVYVDPGQFEQILINLVVNARDAMPSGGTLTIETANVFLSAEYATRRPEVTPGDYVMLAVSDTGVGMDAETLQHIFEPFFTTKPKGAGTGLGLATCYGIVKQHRGHIWAYSEPGVGTTFKVYLPRSQSVHSQSTGLLFPLEQLQGEETVLVVEDDPNVRHIAVASLQTRGYTVLQASSGSEALQVASAYVGTIHLLVTDVIMPGMSGRQLADALAAARPGIRVLFTSGYTDNTIVHHGVLEAGVSFLQKPYTPQALAARVRETLDQSSAWPPAPG
ncbi:MAG: ATP-binding protein [Chloroherpetonaceae bacterium]|nr:ATP-binding protein [Chthonomonadaceae bacterium]MDW8208106.1 ATP-binding protein [Chloroherpetonaceae bacterium]